jgi:hypothetical protein
MRWNSHGGRSPGERERRGTEVGHQDPPELPLAIAQPIGEAGHPVTIDDPVRDQVHRSPGYVAPDIPFG